MTQHTTLSNASHLWHDYWCTRSDAARNALIEHYLPMVRFAAIRMAGRHGRRRQAGDVDDLVQYGIFGLRDAIRGFDPARGFKFETYSMRRIRGAMLDGLKSSHWLPRDIHHQLNRYHAVAESLQAEFGEGAHVESAAGRLGVDVRTVHELQAHSCRMVVTSLHADDAGHHVEESAPRCDAIPDHREEDASESAARRDVRDLLLRQLTRTERHLMMLYYQEELSMREVGEVLGISGTRVSQMHADILVRLRQRFAGRMAVDAGAPQDACEA